jgi:hypothetical protein
MSLVFTYDVITLIELIESKPYVWDKTRGYVFKECIKALFQISCTQYWMYPVLSFNLFFLYFHLRFKSTSNLRFLLLCTNTFLVQRSISEWPLAAAMPVHVKNSMGGARSGKKPVCAGGLSPGKAWHHLLFIYVLLHFVPHSL